MTGSVAGDDLPGAARLLRAMCVCELQEACVQVLVRACVLCKDAGAGAELVAVDVRVLVRAAST